MSYIVLCTFDLKGAMSKDYATAYADLKELGLTRVQVTDNGSEVVIPTTTVAGQFTSSSALNAMKDIRKRVQEVFSSRGFNSEIFVLAAGDWYWGATTT